MNNGHMNATSQSKVSPPVIIKKMHIVSNSPQAVTVSLLASGPVEKDDRLGDSITHESQASNVDGRRMTEVQDSNGQVSNRSFGGA